MRLFFTLIALIVFANIGFAQQNCPNGQCPLLKQSAFSRNPSVVIQKSVVTQGPRVTATSSYQEFSGHRKGLFERIRERRHKK
jgi:hypothetical protein